LAKGLHENSILACSFGASGSTVFSFAGTVEPQFIA
jgi:hypothetical protein